MIQTAPRLERKGREPSLFDCSCEPQKPPKTPPERIVESIHQLCGCRHDSMILWTHLWKQSKQRQIDIEFNLSILWIYDFKSNQVSWNSAWRRKTSPRIHIGVKPVAKPVQIDMEEISTLTSLWLFVFQNWWPLIFQMLAHLSCMSFLVTLDFPPPQPV